MKDFVLIAKKCNICISSLHFMCSDYFGTLFQCKFLKVLLVLPIEPRYNYVFEFNTKPMYECTSYIPCFQSVYADACSEGTVSPSARYAAHRFEDHVLEDTIESLASIINVFRCPKCNINFLNQQHLLEHRRHCKVLNYKCKYCSKEYSSQSGCYKHRVIEHATPQHLRCVQCGRKFANQSDLDGHMNSHLRLKPHRCNKCGRTYAHKNNLITHKKKCNACL